MTVMTECSASPTRAKAAIGSPIGPVAAGWRRVQMVVADQSSSPDLADRSDAHLVELCLDGQMEAEIAPNPETGEAIRATLVPGTLQVRQGGTPARYAAEGPYRVQKILIDDTVFQEAAAAIAPDDPAALAPPTVAGVFDPALKALAEALMDEARNPTLGGDLYADTLAQQIAIRILRRRFEQPAHAQPRRRNLSAQDLARINDHLDADLAGTGGVNALADLLGMEAFAFSRTFRSTTGQSPHQYLIDRRIARVKDLLGERRLSLAEVAYATGFSSQSHMTSTFSKRVGMSPGRWRRASYATDRASA